jgi:hypothetical protein
MQMYWQVNAATLRMSNKLQKRLREIREQANRKNYNRSKLNKVQDLKKVEDDRTAKRSTRKEPKLLPKWMLLLQSKMR